MSGKHPDMYVHVRDGKNQIANFMASSPVNATCSSHFPVQEMLEAVSKWMTSASEP